MLIALTQLLFCQLMGEVIARAFDLAIPGPVIGWACYWSHSYIGNRYRSIWRPQPKEFCHIYRCYLFQPALVWWPT